MNIFFILIVSLFLFLNYLIGHYYISLLSFAFGFNSILLWTVHIVATITMFLAPYIYRTYPTKRPSFFYNALQWCGYTVMGLYSILLVFILLNVSGIFLLEKLIPMDAEKIFKINLIWVSLSLLGALFICVIGFFNIRKKPEIKNIKIPLANLPSEFEGLKILQLSDVHVGQTIKKDFVKTLVSLSNEKKPDIVALTGDMVDGSLEQLADELLPFKEINAPLGKFMVPGNHEYYWGVSHWISFWKDIGFLPLINQHSVIKKNEAQMVMAGVHDYSARRIDGSFISSPKDSLIGSPNDVLKILLAHQPRSVYEAANAGFDLQLSGHTHGGQYFPFSVLIYFFQPFVKGLKQFKRTWIYVNQGTGYWGPPTRFLAPPEITLITLTKLTK